MAEKAIYQVKRNVIHKGTIYQKHSRIDLTEESDEERERLHDEGFIYPSPLSDEELAVPAEDLAAAEEALHPAEGGIEVENLDDPNLQMLETHLGGKKKTAPEAKPKAPKVTVKSAKKATGRRPGASANAG